MKPNQTRKPVDYWGIFLTQHEGLRIVAVTSQRSIRGHTWMFGRDEFDKPTQRPHREFMCGVHTEAEAVELVKAAQEAERQLRPAWQAAFGNLLRAQRIEGAKRIAMQEAVGAVFQGKGIKL